MKTKSTKSAAVDESKLAPKTKARSNKLASANSGIAVSFGKPEKRKKRKWSLSDLKAAGYNPRYISESRLSKLDKSIQELGDLSGVVFNARTNRLISGHQRLKTIKGYKSRIVTQPHEDSHGTIEVGFIEVQGKRGIINIPIRIVDWSNVKVEKAANIAANSHGGEFDQEKLRKVLLELDPNTFDIELLGLDPLTIMSLAIPKDKSKTSGTSVGGAGSGSEEDDGDADDDGFEEYSPDTFKLACSCPRCGYKFDPKEKRTEKSSDLTKAKAKDNLVKVKVKKLVNGQVRSSTKLTKKPMASMKPRLSKQTSKKPMRKK